MTSMTKSDVCYREANARRGALGFRHHRHFGIVLEEHNGKLKVQRCGIVLEEHNGKLKVQRCGRDTTIEWIDAVDVVADYR